MKTNNNENERLDANEMETRVLNETSDVIDASTMITENDSAETLIGDPTLDDPKMADELFNVSSDDIDASLGAIDSPAQKRGKKKSKATIKSEKAVAAFIADRSNENFSKLMECYWWGIKKYSYLFVKDLDMAEDMTITTFEKAWKHIDTFDPEKAKFSTWIWTICRNNCMQYLKQKAKENVVDSDISDIYDSVMAGSGAASRTAQDQYVLTDDGDIKNMGLTDLTHALYDASIMEIKNIGGTAGMILQMKLVDNKKIREIGSELCMNESTVKNYLYKGKSDLNEIMRTKHKELYEMYLESQADYDATEMIQYA